MKKLTTEQFIEKAVLIHGDIYDYSAVDYKNSGEKIKIICKCHEIFYQTPNNHLQGKGCQKCTNTKNCNLKKYTTKIFINKAKLKHKNNFDYSKVNYINSQTNVDIRCNICNNDFIQTPANHLYYDICCPVCRYKYISKKHVSTLKCFIDKANITHGNLYNYDNVCYINSQTPVIIKCNQCQNIFTQTPASHISGTGCKQCADIRTGDSLRMTYEKFI